MGMPTGLMAVLISDHALHGVLVCGAIPTWYVYIYPVTMVSVRYHCGLSVIYPQFELAVRHLGINHLLTITNEQTLQLFTYFTYIASCS